jgi:hypothetical protein
MFTVDKKAVYGLLMAASERESLIFKGDWKFRQATFKDKEKSQRQIQETGEKQNKKAKNQLTIEGEKIQSGHSIPRRL